MRQNFCEKLSIVTELIRLIFERWIDIMSTALLAAFAVILCILFRMLNVNSQPQKPTVHCHDKRFLDTVLKIAPLIQEE